MAEKKDIQFENIKGIGALAGEKNLGALLEKVRRSQREISAVIKGLTDKAVELNTAKAEQAAREAARQAAEAEEIARVEIPEEIPAAKKEPEPAEIIPEGKPVKEKKSAKKPAKKAEEPAPGEVVSQRETVETAAEAKTPVPEEEPKPSVGVSSVGEPPAAEEVMPAEAGKKEISAEKSVSEKKAPENKPGKAKAVSEEDAKPAAEEAKSAPAAPEKPKQPELPSFIVRKADPNAVEERPKKVIKKEFVPSDAGRKDRRPFPPKPGAPSGGVKKPGERTVRTYTAAPDKFPSPIPQKDNKAYAAKKKTEKNFEDKKAVNKRALVKTQISVADFDEDKTGYRKVRSKKQKVEQIERPKIERAVITTEIIPIKTLSEKIGISAVEITKKLFKEGIIKNINDTIDYDTAAFVAADIGVELELKLEKTAEDVLSALADETETDDSKLVVRPPVVTVMGHVDHGKTSLLDKIRSTNVTAGEAGGITQHIGAYTVSVNGKQITFIDTPGHAAFTAMRARGAQVTDIAIIVIAADDGIMPQTIEAINHAKAANVSIIVAANKIDKPTANIDRIRQQLTEHDILVEDWGGDVILAPVSAKTGEGIPELLDTIQIVAEMRDLKANPDRMAKGAIIEAKLDKGKGPVATVLIQNGTLHTGDNVVAGTVVGRVRAMIDDKGRNVKSAGPSAAVSILGLEEVPNAGDNIYAVEQEKLTKLVAQERRNKEREDMIRQTQRVSLDDLFNKIEEGKQLSLNIIIKADVQGSVEAVKQSLIKLSNDEVKVNVIHAAVGAISETDVMLADSSNSIIIGFNVRPDSNAKTIAERRHIDVKLYKIIYEAIDDVQKAMKGLLAPKFKDVYMGKAEVRDTFNITGVGMVAGCYVTEGKIVRSGGKLRIYRNDIMICEGNVLQLKRFKDDVKEVAQGYECGISIENFNDIKIGDFIECYVIEEAND